MTSSPAADETRVSVSNTAVIIAFPARPAGVSADPHARLSRALESLDSALAGQRAAITAWRASLRDLKTTTANLDENLQRYRASLRSLGGSIAALQAKARALESWADTNRQTDH